MMTMISAKLLLLPVLLIANVYLTISQTPPYAWQSYDSYDDIQDRMDAVDASNCASKPAAELRLPSETVAQVPRFNILLTQVIYANRTKLLHTHNMALNRAFFFSYAFQKLNTSETFANQPGFMYYYFSTAADISANMANINGSGIMFDFNLTYANWYTNLAFNQTLPLFGPMAYRLDDYADPTNWIREPTNRTVPQIDYGAGPQSNYSDPSFKINQWYDLWLPDGNDKAGLDSVRKNSYDIGIKYSNQTGQFATTDFVGKTVFGPPSPGIKETQYLPVVFTEPYFDCGQSNRWIVSAVSPVVDQIPRYTDWISVRRFRFTAVSVISMEFLMVDMNQCPSGTGNEPPNYFNNTARCKYATTQCEPLFGWGFRRGGYVCMCKPGFRYPPWQLGPFQGIDLESATEEEYNNGFDCVPIGWQQVIPIIRGNDSVAGPTAASKITGGVVRKRDVQNQIAGSEPYDTKKYARPDWVKATDRAAKSIKISPESRIQNKKMRWLRLNGLAEVADNEQPAHPGGMVSYSNEPNGQRRKIVPRKSYFKQRVARAVSSEARAVVEAEGGKKGLKLQARYKRDFEKVREKRMAELEAAAKTKQKRGAPVNSPKAASSRTKRNVPSPGLRSYAETAYQTGQAFDQTARNRMNSIIQQQESVTAQNCHTLPPQMLRLPGDVSYNVENQFSFQARTALRLAHFLSNFLQNVDIYEEYGNLRGDKLLNTELIFGEAIANVFGDLRIQGSGVFFDIDKYVGPDGVIRQFFGPYAYRWHNQDIDLGERAQTNFRAVDYAGAPVDYLNDDWFRNVKERWQSNTYGLQKFTQKPLIRADLDGSSLRKFELYPMYYYAPQETDGWWSAPYFDCDGYVNQWLITYSTPFFGLNSIGSALEFKGVVIVDVLLSQLDINQCPMDFYVANAFKSSALCHYDSTYCVPITGKTFTQGGYKCECIEGFEYPFNDVAWYFDGQTMEEEFRKMQAGLVNRYATLECRFAGASRAALSSLLVFLAAIIASLLRL